MNTPLKITATLEPWTKEIALRAGLLRPSGAFAMAQQLTLIEHPEGSYCDPFIRLEQREAQQLMDELWHCGLRPSEGSGSAGQAAAMQNHLNDMRTVAFHALKIAKDGKP